MKIKTLFYTSVFHKIIHQGTHEVINPWKLSKSVVYSPRPLPGFCYHWQQNQCWKATAKSRIHTNWNCLCQAFLQGENNIQQLSACAHHICTHFGSIRKKEKKKKNEKENCWEEIRQLFKSKRGKASCKQILQIVLMRPCTGRKSCFWKRKPNFWGEKP